MTITGTTRLLPTLLAGAFAVVASGAFAQSMKFDKPDPDRAYSPYPEQAFPNRVLFGDTHLHTSCSTDSPGKLRATRCKTGRRIRRPNAQGLNSPSAGVQ
jgi:hypothetical protein